MDKKKILCIIIIILLIGIIIFLLMGQRRQNGMMMIGDVVVNYPTLDDDVPYTGRIFDTTYVHEVNVKISDEDWSDLTTNPLDKKKYKVDVVIDGVEIKNVSFKTKGNSSLKNIAEGPGGGPASTRFSFKINFGKYIDDQTYFGLDKLNLNNIYGDTTYLNDYVSYEVFRQAGVVAPLYSFVYVKINGRNHGLYAAVEEVGQSFFERNNLTGNLYKPEQAGGRDNGASLTYKDDQLGSYTDIFDNAETTPSDDDKYRLITSLKKLKSNKDLENALDIHEIIRYFAAHNIVLSYDSYTGKSIHNYYLRENNGQLSLIPWDYNLAFGRYNMTEDITTIVNYGIDTPLSRAEEKNRPMWSWILANEEYKKEYHAVMNEILAKYFESGEYAKSIDDIYAVIQPYVRQDISSFYSPQQVDEAVLQLKDFCKFRSQSIRLQLDGKLSTETTKQDANSRIDASTIDLNKMGLVADDSKKQQNQQGGPQQPQGAGQQTPAQGENSSGQSSSGGHKSPTSSPKTEQ